MASPKDLEAIREELRVLKEGSEAEKITAALGLANLANSSANRRAIEAEGAVGPLVQLVKAKGTENKKAAAQALQALAKDQDVAQAIADQGGRCAQEALKWKLPEAVGEVQGHVNGVKSGSAEEQFFAAEQLGTWAAMSDEKRGEINKAGGCEALVALVVNGSDDAKWHAARALRNLANHAEAKESILKADGIAILTPLAKHGKGKVKEAAGEALNLLSVVDAKAKPAAKPDAASIPSGAGTRVAMFSARFDGGPIEKMLRLSSFWFHFAFELFSLFVWQKDATGPWVSGNSVKSSRFFGSTTMTSWWSRPMLGRVLVIWLPNILADLRERRAPCWQFAPRIMVRWLTQLTRHIRSWNLH